MSVETDQPVLHSIAEQLRNAGQTLDKACGGMPASVDAGAATELVAAILHAFADASGRLTYEADHVADVSGECVADYRTTDRNVMERLDAMVQP
jgi:hypothetical protein